MVEQVLFQLTDVPHEQALRIGTSMDGFEDPRVQYLSRSDSDSRSWDFGSFEVVITSLPGTVECSIRMKPMVAVAVVAGERRAA